MSLDGVPFDAIDASHVEALIQNGVKEGQFLDYKLTLELKTDEQKKEFLGDITSFANCQGGHLVVGVDEHREPHHGATGVPKAFVGLPTDGLALLMRRAEDLMRDGIEPRYTGSMIKEIKSSDGRAGLVIRVPQSLFGPHRVSYQGRNKFFSRNGTGKFEMSVVDLRSAFLKSESFAERARQFRVDRIQAALSEQLPLVMRRGPKILVHLIPLTETRTGFAMQLRGQENLLPPIYCRGWNLRINFDGLLTFHGDRTYCQLFHNGVIEAVDSALLDGPKKNIPYVSFEKAIIDNTAAYLNVLRRLGIGYPIAVFVTLIAVRGFTIGPEPYFDEEKAPFDRDVLAIPEVVVTEPAKAADILKPVFDMIWNAGGQPHSLNYTSDGKWNPPTGY